MRHKSEIIVHRLTTTNINEITWYVCCFMFLQKLPKVIAESANIQASGTIGVRHGEAGRVTAIQYITESDGALSLTLKRGGSSIRPVIWRLGKLSSSL